MQWRDTGVISKGVCKAQMCNILGRDIEWGVILSALSGKASNKSLTTPLAPSEHEYL